MSAIVGGTTTIVDFAPQDPGTGLLDSIDYRINVRAKGKTCVDFALHGMVTYLMDSVFDEVKELPQKEFRALKFLWHITAHHFMWMMDHFIAFWRKAGK